MTVDVCGVPFEVVYDVPAVLSVDAKFGLCEVIPAKITINQNCSEAQRAATLVHEWIHGVLLCNGVSHNEDVVSVLATELYRKGFRVAVNIE